MFRSDTADFASWLEPGILRTQLAQRLGSRPNRRVEVGLVYRGESECDAVGIGQAAPSSPSTTPFHCGCLAKLLTSALVVRAASDGMLALDDSIARFLEGRGETDFGRITVRHLLEHRSGLDQPEARLRIARVGEGFIDQEALLGAIAPVLRLAAPGEMFTYSNTGAWLLAALLEKMTGRTYRALLAEFFAASGMTDAARLVGDVDVVDLCPATGGDLRLTMRDLLAMMRHHCIATGDGRTYFGVDPVVAESQVAPMSGWSSVERGIRLGWKYYGRGWFGHDSSAAGVSIVLRIHPHENAGIVVVSEGRPAILVAARLMPGLFGDFANARMPGPLSAEEMASLDLESCVGRYEGAATILEVLKRDGALQIEVNHRVPDVARNTTSLRASLTAAADGVFLPRPLYPHVLPIVQFIWCGQQRDRYIWNGRRVWRRTAPACG